MPRGAGFLPAVLAAAMVGGCFVVADVDRFETEDPTTTERNLIVELTGFDDYVGARVEIRLLDDRRLRVAVAVIEDMPAEHLFVMPSAVAPGDGYSMDIYVDQNDDGLYTTGEPAWRRDLDDDGYFAFEADDAFVAIDDPDSEPIGEDFQLNLTEMAPHTVGTQAFELVVVDESSGQTVGYYYLSDVDEPGFSAYVPTIIREGLLYRIDFYADFNQNGVYDPPGATGDHSWRNEQTGSTTGINADFVHNTAFMNVVESFPEPD